MKITFGILFTLLISCKIQMEISGELIPTKTTLIELEGKSLWLTYVDSTGRGIEDVNGIHKLHYTRLKYFRKTSHIVDYYGLDGKPLDTNSITNYSRSIERYKKGNLVEMKYQTASGELVIPKYMHHARSKTKYYRNGTWRVRYYNERNKPSCDMYAFEAICKRDTLWQISDADTSGYMLGIKYLETIDCNEKK